MALTLRLTDELQSLTDNRALVDANERTAWLATVVFLRLNGGWVTAPDAYDGIAARALHGGER